MNFWSNNDILTRDFYSSRSYASKFVIFFINIQKEHKILLRPTLGHPNNKPELNKLKSLELSRQKEDGDILDKFERLMNENENIHATKFFDEILSLTAKLMEQFDSILTVDEVIIGGRFY